MSSLPPPKTVPKQETAAAYKECEGPSQGLRGGKRGYIWPWRQNQIFINEHEHRRPRRDNGEARLLSEGMGKTKTAPVILLPWPPTTTNPAKDTPPFCQQALLPLWQTSSTVDSTELLKSQGRAGGKPPRMTSSFCSMNPNIQKQSQSTTISLPNPDETPTPPLTLFSQRIQTQALLGIQTKAVRRLTTALRDLTKSSISSNIFFPAAANSVPQAAHRQNINKTASSSCLTLTPGTQRYTVTEHGGSI